MIFKDEGKSNRGAAAEKYAQRYLTAQHLKIITTNYLTPRGELDIIARDADTLVFVEVRLRSHHQFGSAADSINHRKQQRIIYAAKHYLQTNNLWDKVNCRFDALCLSPYSGNPNADNHHQYQVEWIRNAFSAD